MRAKDDWLPIPVAPKYEINRLGTVRNIESKRVVNPWTPKDRIDDKQVYLRVDSITNTKSFHVTGLVWLVHGIIRKRKRHSRIPVPVIVKRGKNERYYFESCRQAAFFLVKCGVPFSASHIIHKLAKRDPTIGDWTINYQR